MIHLKKWVLWSRSALMATALSGIAIVSYAQNLTPGASINFTVAGNNTATDYATVNVLVDVNGVILRTVSSPFSAPNTNGNYRVFTINYSTAAGGTAPTLSPGTNISAIGGTCTDISDAPLQFSVQGGCVLPGANIAFTVTGHNVASNYLTAYALTDDNGTILSLPTASPVTAPSMDGSYRIYVINYNSDSPNVPPTLAVGSSITAIGGTCVDTGLPLTFCVSSLPVKLVSFSAVKEGSTAQLNWATTEEVNAEKFDIQRSADAKQWASIGQTRATGESKQLVNYTFTDAKPLTGINYYRLKMIDKDDSFAYSTIKAVKFEGGINALAVYPNPVSDILFLKSEEGGSEDLKNVKQVSIINAAGKIAYQSAYVSTSGINVSSLTNGIYIVKVTKTDGTYTTHKLLISK